MENKKQNQTQDKKKKRKILLATLIPVGVLAATAAIVTPTVIACNKNNKNTDIEFGPTAKIDGVSIKSSHIVKGQESNFELNTPSGKTIDDIKLLIGNVGVQKSELTINGNKVTIPAEKMVESKVTIVTLTLKGDTPTPTVITKDEWVEKVMDIIKQETALAVTREYTNQQVSVYENDNPTPTTLNNIDYSIIDWGSNDSRMMIINGVDDLYPLYLGFDETFENLPDEKTTGVSYTYDDNGFYFNYPTQTEGYKTLSFNKYGYLTEQNYISAETPSDTHKYKIVYTGDLIEPGQNKREYIANYVSSSKFEALMLSYYLRQESDKALRIKITPNSDGKGIFTIKDSNSNVIAQTDKISFTKDTEQTVSINIDWNKEYTNYDTWSVFFEESTTKTANISNYRSSEVVFEISGPDKITQGTDFTIILTYNGEETTTFDCGITILLSDESVFDDTFEFNPLEGKTKEIQISSNLINWNKITSGDNLIASFYVE